MACSRGRRGTYGPPAFSSSHLGKPDYLVAAGLAVLRWPCQGVAGEVVMAA